MSLQAERKIKFQARSQVQNVHMDLMQAWQKLSENLKKMKAIALIEIRKRNFTECPSDPRHYA